MAETFGWGMPIFSAAAFCVRFKRRMALMISITRSDLILSLSASGSSKSAKTFLEPIYLDAIDHGSSHFAFRHASFFGALRQTLVICESWTA